MNRFFYLAMEYTNGNLYRGDIFEIALLSERTGYIFHAYIKIAYKLPLFISRLCHITDKKLEMMNLPFSEVIDDLIAFIEQEEESGPPIIITHGGTHMPLLIANCMKNNYDYSRLENYVFVDSIKILQDKGGFEKTGLDWFATSKRAHSAIQDVKILQRVVNKFIVKDILTQRHATTSLGDILHYLDGKLPITIQELLYSLEEAPTLIHLERELYKYASEKTALNRKQIYEIALYYFNIKKELQ